MVAFALDATAARLTLRITRGKGFRRPVTVMRRPTGEPLPITAADVYAFVTLLPSGERVLDLEVADIDGEGPGAFTIAAPPDATQAMPEGSYWWEMGFRDKAGQDFPLIEGVFEMVNRGRHP
jgi:hypothetical protein